MKAFLLVFVLASFAWGADTRLDGARQALQDGLPQVAIYKLRQAPGRKFAKEDQTAAERLLARALFAAGRFDESASLLENSGDSDGESKFWLAENYAALNKPAKALPLYQGLSRDENFAARAAIGAAKMLDALGRASEASEELSIFLNKNPASGEAALKLAEIRLDLGDPAGAIGVLSAREFSPQEQPDAAFLVARALLASGEPAGAEEKLRTIKDPPARLAAGVTVALSECRLLQEDPGEAEKIMETYIEENSRLPGLPAAFAALDRVYVYEGAASSTELRRWTADTKNGQRSALALFYLARNEARSSKGEKSRQLFGDFLAQYPSHFLANEARAELSASQIAAGRAQEALQTAQAGRGFRNSFVRGQAQAASGRYKEAAASFLQASGATELEVTALENSAICALLAGIPEADNEAMRRIVKRPSFAPTVERIRFFEAMRQAATRLPGARDLLRKIADGESAYSQRARLALAEWAFLQDSAGDAGAELRRISTDDPATKERTDYLAIFQSDTADGESDAQVAKLAESFMAQYPDSRYEPHVRMKLGETFYRRGDYLGARGQFGIVAERFSDSPLAEKAVFLTAQAMARSLDPAEMEEAIEIFEHVVKSGGPLSLRARLAQAGLLNALKRPEEALGVLDRILESKPDPELRYTVLIEKGDTLFSQGAQDAEKYRSAIASWKQVSEDPAAPKMWSHQALAKMGAACEKLGNYDAALDCYYGAFSQGQKGGPEYFWFYKAGFDAARLLESQKLWKEAIAVYEKIGSVDGPRAEEARDRINRLRLENFIWEN